MMSKREDRAEAVLAPGAGKSETFGAAGSVLGAVAASSCCILPLVLFSLGVGGAWMSNLTALAPYQPYLIALTVMLLGYGYWHVYRRSRAGCAGDQACARPASTRP